MHVTIIHPERRSTTPRWLKAEAEVVFDANEPMLEGLKLVGFSIGQSNDGQKLFVKFPGRSYTVTKDGKDEIKTFEFLRCTEPRDFTGVDRLRQQIIEAYLADGAEAQPEAPAEEPFNPDGFDPFA